MTSVEPAAPVDPGTIEPTPDGSDPPTGEAGSPDGPVTPAVAPGAVDPSYGTKGVATGSVGATPTIRFSGDGRTVIFEHKTNVYATLTALVSNGTPDKSHGADGVAEVPIPNAMNHSQSLSASARIENDGSVYVSGGMKQEGVYNVPFVGRVQGNGLDYTFGSGGGLWTFPDVYAVVGNVLVDRNAGGTVKGFYTLVSFSSLGGAGGGTPRDASVRVYHLTAAGVTDATFGGGKGYFELPTISQVVLDSSGLPIVMSSTSAGPLEVRRLTTAGALDTTYGTGGVASIAWTGQTSFSASTIALAKGGLLSALNATGSARIVRLDAKGAVADAFPGSATRDIPNAQVTIASELADGRLLVSHYDTTGATTLERWLADGKPDAAFGTAGKVDVSAIIGKGSYVQAISATTSGATMLASSAPSGSSTVWSVRRLGP